MGSSLHKPVMVAEVVGWLAPRPGQLLVDGTIGVAGHALALLPYILPSGLLIGLDVDPMMVKKARENLVAAGFTENNFRLFCSSYTKVEEIIMACGGSGADGILIDAGICADQLFDPGRGLSFSLNGPLDGRLNQEDQTLTIGELVNRLSWQELADIFRRYGDEPQAKRIAKAIVNYREKQPISTTTELAEIIVRAKGKAGHRRRHHPATTVFQALRIAVNNELDNLRTGMVAGLRSLKPGGRMVVISYHSGEDRIVKSCFRSAVGGELRELAGREYQILTLKPLKPTSAEIKQNPRARSARLRVIERKR
ncbi:MAG: 16S rRNA (cytosine(1402)-N(4))-methyltransferase RsmH [Candidatus Sumerlaeia bacterium]|nr:16S rRNA (cytosine(1402)-N(4))-methyltransferase RsmH [Candidatus Sumerlaeia bacterium]